MSPSKSRARLGRRQGRQRERTKSKGAADARSGRLTRVAAYATIAGTLFAAATVAIALGTSAHGSSHSRLTPAILQPLSLVVKQTQDKPSAEVILHNLGSQRSIVTEAQTQILAAGQLTLCGSQGELDLSENYNVLLPATPAAGEVISTPLHEQLAGDEADRFSLSFATVGSASLKEFKLPQRIHVYELQLALLHDDQGSPLQLGKVVIAVPTTPRISEYFLTAATTAAAFRRHMMRAFGRRFYVEHRACYRHNGLALKRLLALPGARDPALTAAASHLVIPR
jgi:hypothetical protein